MTEPRAASPITASMPAEIRPEEFANQGDAGIEKVEWPSEPSVISSSVR